MARVSWLVDSKLGGPPQVWGLITGVFDFEDQAPRSPWHLLWEKDLGQVKAVLGPDLPAQQTEQIFQHLIGLSEASRKKLLARCLSFRNWETLDRDVFCPDCSSKFLDQRWLRFHQKRVHTHRDPNPEDALLDIKRIIRRVSLVLVVGFHSRVGSPCCNTLEKGLFVGRV